MSDLEKSNAIKPGLKIRYHGGWCADKERCEICNFQCDYIWTGVIVERYTVWDYDKQKSIPDPELWTVKIDGGGYIVGSAEQFEIFS